ncbi:hypothetical protein SEA_DATBOI_158 [Gordonia phage DatBoi]|nr:hypothetical protein SEA_DATBOI_158 [Gordonia phage DatBoi]
MHLYEFDYTHEGYALDLTPETLSTLTGVDVNRLSGMFGSGDIGRVAIIRDGDHSWQDICGDMEGCAVALFIEPGSQSANYTCTDLYDENSESLAAFREAVERIYPDHREYCIDRDYVHKVLTRYGALLGLNVEFRTFAGEGPSDWLPVISVTPVGVEENSVADEMEKYWDGEVYGYVITLESPLGDVIDSSVWGFVGDEYVVSEVVSELKWAIEQVSAQIREAKAA